MKNALAVLLVLAALPLGACRKAVPPSTVVYGRGEDAESLDPQAVDDGESAKVINNLFDGLVTFGPGTSDIVPSLAESWTTSPDGLEWTFRLRQGVKFHDGTPFDAAAVIFTMGRILDEKHPFKPDEKVPYAAFYRGIVRNVTMKGPDAVVFRLSRPYAPFLANMAMFSASMVSPKAVEAAGSREFGKKPVGTGAFRFESWSQGEKKIVLVRDPGHWRGAAAVERIIFRTIPDSNARLTALRSGDINWMDGVPCEEIGACRKDARLKVWSATGFNVGYLALNTERKPFDDPRVRRAVSLAIDRRRLVDALFYGAGVPAVHPMPPGTPGYDASTPLPAADPAKAKALLAEAGYRDGFDTDLFAMPNPRPYFPAPLKTAEVLKADLAAVGIRAKIETPGDFSLYREALSNGRHSMGMLGWTTDNGDPDNFLFTFFAEENAKKGPGALNISFWVDPAMQDLLRRGQDEIDPAKRAAVYRDALARVADQVPMVPVAHAEAVFVSRAGYEGFNVQPTGDVIFHGVKPPAAE
jgi:peptide/nickel transport system substrate-binding protein